MFDSLSGKGRNPQDFRAGLSNESREFIRKFPLQANSDRTYQYGDRKLSLTTLYNAREELEKVLAGNATNREFSIAFRWYVNQLQRAGQDGGYIDGAPFLGCTALLQEVQLVKAGTPEAKQL